MTIPEAQKLGRAAALKATAIILVILVLLLLVGETRGDFANGILFFMQTLLSPYTLVFLLVLFGLTYYFAGLAAAEIIFEKQNNLWVATKYVVLLSLAICAVAVTAALMMRRDFSTEGLADLFKTYLLGLFFKAALFLAIAWRWATNKMKAAQVK